MYLRWIIAAAHHFLISTPKATWPWVRKRLWVWELLRVRLQPVQQARCGMRVGAFNTAMGADRCLHLEFLEVEFNPSTVKRGLPNLSQFLAQVELRLTGVVDLTF